MHPLVPQAGAAPRPRRHPQVRSPGRPPPAAKPRPPWPPRPPRPRPRARPGQAHPQPVPRPLASACPHQPARPHRRPLHGPAARSRATLLGARHLKQLTPLEVQAVYDRLAVGGRRDGKPGAWPPAHPGRAPLPAPRPGPGGHLAAARPQRRHRHPPPRCPGQRWRRWRPSRSPCCWTPPATPPHRGLAPGRCSRRRPAPATASCAAWNGPISSWTPAPSVPPGAYHHRPSRPSRRRRPRGPTQGTRGRAGQVRCQQRDALPPPFAVQALRQHRRQQAASASCGERPG